MIRLGSGTSVEEAELLWGCFGFFESAKSPLHDLRRRDDIDGAEQPGGRLGLARLLRVAPQRVRDLITAPRLRKTVATVEHARERLGQLYPIVVTKDGCLIAGERRPRACEALGWPKNPRHRCRPCRGCPRPSSPRP